MFGKSGIQNSIVLKFFLFHSLSFFLFFSSCVIIRYQGNNISQTSFTVQLLKDFQLIQSNKLNKLFLLYLENAPENKIKKKNEKKLD